MTGSGTFGTLVASLQYANYQAQPDIGYYKRREGVSTSLKYKIDQNYFLSSSVIFDLSRHLYNSTPAIGGHAGILSLAGLGLGIGYTDDCTTFSVNYASVYTEKAGSSTGTVTGPVRNQTILFQLQLRTLGDTRFQSSLGDIKVQDGLGGLSGH